MHARVSFYRLGEGTDPDTAVKGFENSVGAVEELEGQRGVMLLVDRDSRKAITITYWDSEEHLRSSAEQANQIRRQAADSGGLTIEGVENYEVALERGR
jgi:heme-degrading monooxygenase HmoA